MSDAVLDVTTLSVSVRTPSRMYRPPTFSLFGNQLEHLPESYVRYLMNGIRESFDLWGTPLRFNRRGSRNPFDRGKR